MANSEDDWFEEETSEQEQAVQCQKVARVLDLITARLQDPGGKPGLQEKFACKALPQIGFAEFTRRFNQFGGISSNLLIAGLMFTDRALKTKIFTKQTTVHK